MLAFLESRVGIYVIVAIGLLLAVGGVALHMKLTADQIVQLQQQVTTLTEQAAVDKATNAALQKDVAAVQQAQNEVNDTLQTVRLQATALEAHIRVQQFTGLTGAAIEKQVNQDIQSALQRLQTDSK